MATSIISKKVNHIYLLLEKLASGEELYPQNPGLQSELDVNERTLRRYLEDIHSLYSHIVLTQKIKKEFSDKKVTVYRVVDMEKDVSEIFRFFLLNSNDLSWLLQLAYENNPSLIKDCKDDSRRTLEKIIKNDEDVFLFINYPFESMSDDLFIKHFKNLKLAVKNHEYRTIDYNYMKKETLEDVKCLKIVYTDNNWYIAIETNTQEVRLLRIAFIEKVSYSKKTIFHKTIFEKHTKYLKNIQNAMSLDQEPKTARLIASRKVAIYFTDRMKKFFPSQKYIQTLDDGSVEFSIDYTNDMEILPFIKKWLPDIEILGPVELKNRFLDDVKRCYRSLSS